MRTIITVGTSAAGKTTAVLAISQQQPTVIFSPDDLLYNEGGTYEWSPQRVAQAWQREYVRFGALLRDQKKRNTGPVAIWDATFTTRLTRCALVNIARAFGRVEAWYFATPLEVCLTRNSQRSPDRRVPDETLTQRYERIEIPSFSEGFHSVVRLSGLEKNVA